MLIPSSTTFDAALVKKFFFRFHLRCETMNLIQFLFRYDDECVCMKKRTRNKKREQDEGNKSNMKEGRKKGHVRTSMRMRAMFVCGILFLFTSCSRQHAPKPIMPRTRIIFKYSHSMAEGLGWTRLPCLETEFFLLFLVKRHPRS